MSQEQPPIRSRRELRQARDEKQATGSTGPGQASPASKQPPAQQADSVGDQTQAQRSSQLRAKGRAALRTIKELEEKEGQLAAGGPLTRRQLRLQQLKEQAVTSANPVVPPAPARNKSAQNESARTEPAEHQAAATVPQTAQPAASPQASGIPAGVSVEQALAARALIAEQAKNQLAKMEHIASLDPETVDPEAVDPEVLAEQIALAERAAVLNRRARAKQKLAEQTTKPAGPQDAPEQSSPRPAPSTVSNLAMVTPLEFVEVPGVDRPVMKPPATSYVPVLTEPGTKVKPSGGKGGRPASGPRPPGGAPAPAVAGRSRVIARAEAAAKAGAEPKPVIFAQAEAPAGHADDLFDDLPRIPARSAHGLEPLDAATAGLARAKRMRIIQFCVLAFGIVALISGIMLIISGITR
jgi:hypothetical protein